MADMVVDSNIYNEVHEDIKVLEPEYEKVKADIDKIIDDGGTVPKNKIIEKYEKVVIAQVFALGHKDHFLNSRESGLTI